MRFFHATCMLWVKIPARFNYEVIEDIMKTECIVILFLVFV